MRYMNCSFRPRSLALAVAACLLLAAGAHAQTTTVCLVAKPFTATGAAAGVPMWGYAQVPFTNGDCVWDLVPAPAATSPGPRITVLPTDTTLTIHLLNKLPEATSIVIPGLPFTPGTMTRVFGRAASFTSEVAAANCPPPSQGNPDPCTPSVVAGVYTWSNLRPGTYLYQTGSHVQVQVQMGLFGAVTKDAVAAAAGPPATLAQAYAGKEYAREVVLFYSEVDPTLHQAVATGAYDGLLPIPASAVGTVPPPRTSTFDYEPRYFLVNGNAYPATSVTAGGAGTTTLIRFLNAGLRTHVPTLLNGDFELLAEDGHAYPYARRQVQLSLPAGKTTDVLWTPAYAGTYPVFDRAPHLTTNGDGPGGMIVNLAVGGTIIANPDTYGARNDKPLVVGAPGVMGNDSAITTASVVAGLPPDGSLGTLVFNSDGSFTYTAPSAVFTGPVTFTYQQPASLTATVTINVGPNAPPVANNGTATTAEDTPKPITLTATDPNSDPLTYTAPMASLTCAAPLAKGSLTGTGAARTYTPNANVNGTDCFGFQATDDGPLSSNVATVTVNITPVNDAPVANPASWPTTEDVAAPYLAITLTGSDIDGTTPLTFRVTTNPANGTLSGLTQVPPTTATVTYRPRLDFFGTDTFRFVVRDGTVDSPVATITIPVTGVADNPIAANDSYSTKYNASLTMNVLVNDRDPDGTPLSINNPAGEFPKCFNSTTGAPVTPCTTSTPGVDKVTIASAQNRLTLVPNAGVRRNRTLSFQYRAKDGSGALSSPATVTVNVLR